jgi:O-antigen ligase
MNLRNHRFPAIAVLVSFWAWCALVSYPMISSNADLAELQHTYTTDRIAVVGQATGLLMFLATISLTYFSRISSAIRSLTPVQIAIFLIIYLSFSLQLHDDEAGTFIGIFYTCLLLVTALMLSVLWTLASDDLEKCMSVASVILCLFGITALAILGLPQGRNVGNIQPNLFAAPLLVAFIFSQFRSGRVGIVVRILCLGMVALVSSRFALIGCISALVIHELTFNSLSPGKIPALVIALVGGILFWPQIASVLALDDSSRDLSSGFSGRDELWHLALAAITDHPFGIGFKRAIGDESGHNGYLKTLLEFGVVGGGLIIFLIGCVLVIAGVEAIRSSGKDRQQHRFACARFGGLVALSFGAFFQPQLFNVGDAFGMSVLFLLFKPKMDPISDRSLAGKAGHPG